MELYTVKVEMTLVLATRDGEEPTNEDIAKALANEIKCNGFIAGSKRVKSVNKRERYVAQILREDKGDWE
jgi:hypothetical protein